MVASIRLQTTLEYIDNCINGKNGWPSKEMLETLVKLAKVEAFNEAEKVAKTTPIIFVPDEISRLGKILEKEVLAAHNEPSCAVTLKGN